MRKHSRSTVHQNLRDNLAKKASYLRSNYKEMSPAISAWHKGYIAGCLAAIKVELDNSHNSGHDWRSAFRDYNQAQLVWARLRLMTSSFATGYDYRKVLTMDIKEWEAYLYDLPGVNT